MSKTDVRILKELLMKAILSGERQQIDALLSRPYGWEALKIAMKDLFVRFLNGDDVEREIVLLSFHEKFDKLIISGLFGALLNRFMNGLGDPEINRLASLLERLFDEKRLSGKMCWYASNAVCCFCTFESYIRLIEKLGSRLEE